MHPVAWRLLTAFVVLGTLGPIWAVSASSQLEDPRNSSLEYWDAMNGGRCYNCHLDQGFHPMQIGLVERFQELPVGDDVGLGMRIVHMSRMAHQIQDIAVVVNLSRAPNVVILDDSFVEDLELKENVTLLDGDTFRRSFEILPKAEEILISMRATGEETLAGTGLEDGDLVVTVADEKGRVWEAKGGPLEKRIERQGDEALRFASGTLFLEAKWSSSMDPEMAAEFEVVVRYPRPEGEVTIRAPEGTILNKGEDVTVPIPIRVTGPGEAFLDFRVESISYFTHTTRDAPRDDGLFYRFTTMKVQGGDQNLSLGSAFAPQPLGPAVDLYNLFARVVGFLTLFLVPAALVTGGIFGRGSRRWMNRMTGGAKRRVLWHMGMSWAIIVLASVHFLLALYESRSSWTTGLLWGGLGWALLVSLGFTGYYQARMIKRWDYRIWRQLHLWPAVGVLVFGLVHMVFDGSDLGAIRELLPETVRRLGWP